jgi:hypothetical protein
LQTGLIIGGPSGLFSKNVSAKFGYGEPDGERGDTPAVLNRLLSQSKWYKQILSPLFRATIPASVVIKK